ncbi:MAG TPA: hypothetical protein DIT04_08305 [Dysgonomonas sp.]|nr:hypothetical protein [Dysgonomonas sp.]
MDSINIYKSKRKGIYLIIFFLLLLVVGILLLGNTDKNVAGWGLIILGSLSLITGLYMILDRRPQIIISSEGVSVYNLNYELIEWDAISTVDEIWFRGQLYVVVLLDRSYKTSQIPDLWFYRINRLYERSDAKAILIRTSMLDVKSDEILALMKAMITTDSQRRIDLIHSHHLR